MKGVSNIVALSALLVVAMALVAIILPWAWNAMSQVVDVLGRASTNRSMEILSSLVLYPPPVAPPAGKDVVMIVANVGETTLRNVKVLAIKPDLTQLELNFYIIKRDGSTTGWGTSHPAFSPGDVIVARVPNDTNYMGYQLLVQSPDYAEAYLVGG